MNAKRTHTVTLGPVGGKRGETHHIQSEPFDGYCFRPEGWSATDTSPIPGQRTRIQYVFVGAKLAFMSELDGMAGNPEEWADSWKIADRAPFMSADFERKKAGQKNGFMDTGKPHDKITVVVEFLDDCEWTAYFFGTAVDGQAQAITPADVVGERDLDAALLSKLPNELRERIGDVLEDAEGNAETLLDSTDKALTATEILDVLEKSFKDMPPERLAALHRLSAARLRAFKMSSHPPPKKYRCTLAYAAEIPAGQTVAISPLDARARVARDGVFVEMPLGDLERIRATTLSIPETDGFWIDQLVAFDPVPGQSEPTERGQLAPHAEDERPGVKAEFLVMCGGEIAIESTVGSRGYLFRVTNDGDTARIFRATLSGDCTLLADLKPAQPTEPDAHH